MTPNGNGGGIGPKTKVSLGVVLGFLAGGIAVAFTVYQWRAFEIKSIRDEQDTQTAIRRDLDEARADIITILRWQREHTDFSNDVINSMNNNFEVLRLGEIQALEYMQRDAEVKHIRPPNIPGRLYEPMLMPGPRGIGKEVPNSLRDLIREYRIRALQPHETSGPGGG